MPFSPITSGSTSFIQSGPSGRYVLSTSAFGDPANYLQVSGCSPVKKRPGTVAGGLTHVFEQDVTINGLSQRKRSMVQLILTVDQGIPAASVDSQILIVSDVCTSAFLNRLLNGES